LHLAAGFLVVELEPGVIIRIADPDDAAERHIVFGHTEQKEIDQFMSLAKPGMTFFDVGANIGLYSLLAANRVGLEGQVHAFEPTPALVGKLKMLLDLNSFQNVTVNEIAVSDQSGTAQFFLAEESVNNSFGSVSDRAITVSIVSVSPDLTAENEALTNSLRTLNLIANW
jgi:FkbM family methyltransferase